MLVFDNPLSEVHEYTAWAMADTAVITANRHTTILLFITCFSVIVLNVIGRLSVCIIVFYVTFMSFLPVQAQRYNFFTMKHAEIHFF